MIRIREEQWVSKDSIESCFVRDGSLQLVATSMQGADVYPYLVEENYLEDVCGSLSLPYGTVKKIMVQQNQEKENAAVTGGGDSPTEEPAST